MEIFDILDEKCVEVGLKSKTKDEVLHELAELACRSDTLEGISSEVVYNKLAEREAQGSTGLGNEIAIPHARIEGMKNLLLYIAVPKKPLEFDSLDKKKVKVFFVILCPPEMVNDHLKTLAMVSRLLVNTNVKNEILACKSGSAAYETFIKNSKPVEEAKPKEKVKMKLMVVILFIEEMMYDILELFIEQGIEGATVIESYGMGEYISNIPIFADFIGFMKENKNRSKTILVMVPENEIDSMIGEIEKVTGDIDKQEGAMVMTLPVDLYKGSMKMM